MGLSFAVMGVLLLERLFELALEVIGGCGATVVFRAHAPHDTQMRGLLVGWGRLPVWQPLN